jgi:hypothetical protein
MWERTQDSFSYGFVDEGIPHWYHYILAYDSNLNDNADHVTMQ